MRGTTRRRFVAPVLLAPSAAVPAGARQSIPRPVPNANSTGQSFECHTAQLASVEASIKTGLGPVRRTP